MKKLVLLSLFSFVLFIAVGFAQYNDECLVIYYPFNGNLLDQSGYANNATNHGAVLTTGHNGTPNGAYKLAGNTGINGSDIWIEIPDVVDSLDQLTISLWVKQDASYNSQYGETYISFGTLPSMGTVSTSIYYDITYNQIRFVLRTTTQTYEYMLPFSSSWLGTYQHYAMVYSSSQARLWAYHNGQLVGTMTNVSGTVESIGNYAGIGKHWWANGAGHSTRLNASFDEVRVYKCALDSNQIHEDYSMAIEQSLIGDNRISVYPNPATDILTVEFDVNKSGTLIISDMTGKMLLSRELSNTPVAKINVEDLSNGVYLVGFVSKNGENVQYTKLIIQR